MDNKLLTLTFILSLLFITSVSALSNDGGGSWTSYKDLNLGYHTDILGSI